MDNVLDFFREKKPWSKYKDLILDYYLKPYLAKVNILKRPILIVDCFAGPGRFKDGEPGSPLIISERLQEIQKRGAKVQGLYIEKNPILYKLLETNTHNLPILAITRLGDFREHLDEIADLAKTHTVFVYLDPIKPNELLFDDMESIYTQLEQGRSVETLINLMSTNFLRAVRGIKNHVVLDGLIQTDHELVSKWNRIAGGPYWQQIAFDSHLSEDNCADQFAKGYANQLRRWFKGVITYPIREKYEHKSPKYHMIFGSRYPGAIELMNRAMVNARRQFIKKCFIEGHLFPNQPEKEIIKPEEIEKIILQASRKVGKTTWANLRLSATIANPPTYTDSEFNRAIKELIKERLLHSDCPGTKIEENALIWPSP